MTTVNRQAIFESDQASAFPDQRRSDFWYKAVSYGLLSLLGITMLIPLMWMIATSFKTANEIILPQFFPGELNFENYEFVLSETELPRWYLNSLIVAIISTVSVAFFDTLAGYVFAKYQFPGKRIVFIAFLTSLMVPTEMLIIPWFVMSADPIIGSTWIDTYWGIAFPGVITATGIFLMRQFM